MGGRDHRLEGAEIAAVPLDVHFLEVQRLVAELQPFGDRHEIVFPLEVVVAVANRNLGKTLGGDIRRGGHSLAVVVDNVRRGDVDTNVAQQPGPDAIGGLATRLGAVRRGQHFHRNAHRHRADEGNGLRHWSLGLGGRAH